MVKLSLFNISFKGELNNVKEGSLKFVGTVEYVDSNNVTGKVQVILISVLILNLLLVVLTLKILHLLNLEHPDILHQERQ